MSQIGIIKESFAYFPLVAFVFTIPYLLVNYRRYGSVFSLRVLIVYSFILYLMTVYFLVILPLPDINYVASMTTPKWQPIPFSFVGDIYKEYVKTGSLLNSAVLQYLYNVLMLVPFGMYLHYYFECDLKKIIKLSFLLSLFFELTQLSGLYFIYPRPYRLFDIDDLISNTLGGVLGFYLIIPFKKVLPSRELIDSKSRKLSASVSFLRRLTAFGVDFVVVGIIDAILFVMFDFARNNTFKLTEYLFVGYFVLLPLLTNGRTAGLGFVHCKVEAINGKYSRLKSSLRYLIAYLAVVQFPIALVLIARGAASLMDDERALLICLVMIAGIYGMFIFVEIILVIFNKPILCERFSRTRIVSTLKQAD